jgi:L-alanine-DL-glutamate epimerase-like enolase superfamily enzyme
VDRLQHQLRRWADAGIRKVKMKVGAHPADDISRVAAARDAIGDAVELFVDANGAYTPRHALEFAGRFAELGVRWFEEPVSSDDLRGLAFIRVRAPSGMNIAAGEYGYDSVYFRRMLEAAAVDVLQIDATRCTGVTGFLEAAALGAAYQVPVSSHTAPLIHAHLCCAAPTAVHAEYFHDHVRIESMLFDGIIEPVDGILYPDPSRPGLGIEFKHSDAERYAA